MPIASHLLTLPRPSGTRRAGFFVFGLPDRDPVLADDDLRLLGRVTLDDALDPIWPQLVLSRVASSYERSGQQVGHFLFTIADAYGATVVDLDDGAHAHAFWARANRIAVRTAVRLAPFVLVLSCRTAVAKAFAFTAVATSSA